MLYKNVHEDRKYYDDIYKSSELQADKLDFCYLEKLWEKDLIFKKLLDEVGDIKGKTILLLGNGMSLKEFFFLKLGARIVYSDISIKAVQMQKQVFENSLIYSEYKEQIEFHAVDALNLPFAEESFDLIYGFAFVHHLPDSSIYTFLNDVKRCLKRFGKVVFFDDAYSPLWHGLKQTILKPLQKYSHRNTGISPEDIRATEKGGFKRQEIQSYSHQLLFSKYKYQQHEFFSYIMKRGHAKLKSHFFERMMPLGLSLDKILMKNSSFIKNNGIRLIWGFEK